MASDDDGMPPERDVKEFKFQQLCKVQVSEKWQGQSSPRSQLLACSSKYGLTFVAVPGGMKVLKTADISQKDSQHAKDKNTVIIKDCPVWTAVELQQNLSHIALNCDEQLLMTVATQNNILSATFYLVSSFGQQNGTPVVVGTCRLGGSCLMLSDAAWNPAIPQLLAVCLSDGSVSLITISQQMSVTAKIPPTAQATCLCWSPKGKQLVVGKLDGTLSQYDQAGTEKKRWPIPSCLPSPQARVVDVVWESTHMFVGVYMPSGSTESDQPHVIITNAPKDGNVSFVSFEDLCFGSGEGITPKYFKAIIPKWEMMVLCSASSSSATILGKSPATQSSGVWERWNLEDSGRAELPLNEEYADTFPLGMAIDYSSQLPIILEDKSSHPPCPLLLLLSTEGQLVPFYMVYTLQGAPALTSPPETLPGGTTLTGIQPAKPATTTGLLSSATSQQPNPPSTVAKSLFGVPASSPAPAALFGDANKSGFTFGGAVPSTVAPTSVPSQTSSGVKPFLTGPEASTQGYQFPGFGANTGRNPLGSQQSPALTLGQTSQSSDSFSFGQSGPSMAFVGKSQGASTEITSSPFGQANSTPAVSSTPIGQSRPVTMATSVQQPPKQTAPLAQPIPVSQSKAPAQQTILSQSGQAAAARLGQSVTTTSQQPQQQTQSSLKRPQETPLSQTSTSTDATPIDEQKTETINKAVNSEFTRLIQEEMAHFQREINDLRERAGRTCTQIGSSEDRNKLVQSTNSMCEFSDGIRETTQTQHKEIQDLKSQLLDLFSVVEETRIQQQRNNDNKYRHLLQSRSLDPASADKMRQLSQQYQGVERGVEDLDLVLDNQWEEYLLNKKQSNKRLQRPTFDSLYRVVRMHDNLIVGQKKNIDRVQGAVKQLRLYNKSSTLASPARTNQSCGKDRDINLSSLADSLLEKSNTPVDRPQPARPKGLSPEKEAKLREFLCNRTPRTIKSSRPDMSMSKIVSSPAVRKRLTELETSLSADNGPSDGFKSTATGMMTGVSQPQTRPMLSNQASVPQTERLPIHLSGQVTAPPAGLTESYPQGSLASVSGSRLNGNGTGFSGIPNQRQPSVTDVSETNDVGETRTPVISEIGSEEYLAEYGAGDADGEQYDAGYYDEDDETADDETADEETEQEPLESYSESDAAGELAQTNSAFSFTSDGSTAPGAFFLTGVQTAKPSTVTRNLFGTTSLPAFGSAASVSGSATVSTGASGFSLGVNTVPISGTLAQKPSAPSVSSASGTIVSSGTAKPEQTGFSFGLRTSGSSAFMGQASDNNKGLQGILPKPVAFGQMASNDSKRDSVSTKPSSQVASATTTTLSTTVSRSFNAQPEETSTLQAAASEDQAIGRTSGTEAAKVQDEKKAEGASGFSFGSSSSGFSFGGTGFSFKNTGAFQGAMGGTVTVLASGEGESVPTASSQAKSETPFGDAPVPTASTATTSGPANSSGGLFGSAGSKTTTASSAAGLFATKTSTASSTGLFGSTQSSASSANELGGEAVAADTASTTTDGGLFGMPAVSAAGGSSLFGSKSTATTASASLFGSATTTTTAPSLFGNTATTSGSGAGLFGTTTTTAASGGLFGAVTTTTTAPSVFGNTATTSASGVGVFGTTTTTAAGGGLFGAAEGTGTTSAGVFGSSTTTSAATTTSSGGLFGSSITSTAATTTSASIFGSNTPASASGGLFGSSSTTSAPAATTTSASIFGSNTQVSTGGGLFGSSSTTSAPGGLFGSSSSTSAGGGLFGKPSVTQSSSAGGLFGSSSTEATTTAAGGLFGSSLPATSSGGGLFGASSTNQPGGGIFGASSASTTSSSTLFGSSTTTTASSLFGSTTTTSSGGLFGSGATTTVASGGLFGSTTTTQAPGGGVFGSATPSTTTSGSVFGSVTTATSGGSSLFGANTVSNTGTSVFGSNTTATSGSSTFGSTAASTGTGGFSFGGTTAPSSGGGFLGGLGGRPTAENASKNVFGSSSFGTATSSTTNLFGSGGASGFGGGFGSSTSQASAGFGSGVNVASQGFGVAQTAQQATFGGSPAFGSNPSFGGSPAFGGGSAAFGSSPVFGGNKPVFGGASTFGSPPAAGGSSGIFGGGSATSAGFAGLANSNSPTFGSLAHQQPSSGFGEMAQQAQAPAPSFGSPGFGGGQPAGFGSPSFGSSPAFTGYRS